ncbi:MAG: hypothetical protein AB1656_21265 [Candidatus Omnitrophota bacterium]
MNEASREPSNRALHIAASWTLKILIAGLALVLAGWFILGKIRQDHFIRTQARIALTQQNLKILSSAIDAYCSLLQQPPPPMQDRFDLSTLRILDASGAALSVPIAALPLAAMDPFAIRATPLFYYYTLKDKYLLVSPGPDQKLDIDSKTALAFLLGEDNISPYTFDPTNGLGVPFTEKRSSGGDIWASNLPPKTSWKEGGIVE